MAVSMTKTGGVVVTNVKCPVTLDREGVEFPYWDMAFVAACGLKRCKEALSTPMPDTEENAAALLMLIESVPKVWGSKLASMKIASAAYQWVRQKFTGGADQEVTSRWLELLHKGMTETETLEEYYNRMVALYEALKGNGHPIMERDVKLAIIKGLPEAAKETGMISSAAGKDLEGLWEIIATTAKGLGFDDRAPRVTPVAKAVSHTIPTTSTTASPQEGSAQGHGTGQRTSSRSMGRDRRNNRTCYRCRDPGHFERDCPLKKAEEKMQQDLQRVMAAMANLLPPPVNQATAAAVRPPASNGPNNNFFPGGYPPPSGMSATITLNVLTPTAVLPEIRSFMIDSGASIHLVNDLSLLHSPTLHSTPIPLHMATSDATGQIIATGSICLSSIDQQPLWLHHVHCVPSATANLISVTAAIRDGASFMTDSVGGYIGMRGPCDWNCPVEQRNGLYFLQKVNPIQNHVPGLANAMRAQHSHDCRLRALWHSRLGHPGEANMRRLQCEDLISGIPVSLSPCENCPTACEACIQGKHSRPPFGISTRTATEPLQRVHLDTVGPITPTAITGERFFVTIVDEASHYVIALAVKSKDAISGAVRDLLVFWQRQLGRTVKCIRTDRGTEFLNSTLKGYCVQEGIKFETSAAYTPQQNGLAERMNRTIKEKARTLLLHAAAKQTLWKEAVETACILYNMGPVAGRDKTPYELFHGVKPDASLLKTFGCLAHVHIPDHQRGVFESKTSPGLFTGYSSVSKAYRIYMGSGIWKESRDVVFLEHIRGADRVGLSTMSAVSPTPVQQSFAPHFGQHNCQDVPGQPSFWDSDDLEPPCSREVDGQPSELDSPCATTPCATSPCATNSCENYKTTNANRDGETTSAVQSPTETGRSWSVLGHMKNLARGGQETLSQCQRLNDMQACLRNEAGAVGARGQDGLTREQRYEQRVMAREAAAREMDEHEGVVSDGEKVRMPETSLSGEASGEELDVQPSAMQEGMSDHVSDESEAREASLESANQTLEEIMEASDGQALRACEGHTGESQVCCESEDMSERESTAVGNPIPNYAASLSAECVWGEISSMGNNVGGNAMRVDKFIGNAFMWYEHVSEWERIEQQKLNSPTAVVLLVWITHPIYA